MDSFEHSPEDLPEREEKFQQLQTLQQLGDTSVSMWSTPTVRRKTKIVCTIGMMSFLVKSKTEDSVKCEVVDGGELRSRRHLNVRGKSATLPSITEKDWDDIKFGVDNKVDFYAVSFVKDAQVVHELKNYLKSCNADIQNHMGEMFAYHATMMSNTLGTSIVVFTKTGFMAILLSHYRPSDTIFAFTNDKTIQQRLSLYQGVCPIYMQFSDDAEETFENALGLLQKQGMVKEGEEVALVQSGRQSIWRFQSTHNIQIAMLGSGV
ncbi:hypothetical protein Q3G72_003998 [Acer saccharum]|nr:hypothetical protein Q3G72_003998 [Acer saccharum]